MVVHHDWPFPSPGDDDVLVEVAAVSLNPVDWKIAVYNFFKKPFPFANGADIAGTVKAHGKNVKHLPIGTRVVAWLNLTAACSFAEYVVFNQNYFAIIPDKVSFVDAASLPVAFLSAWEGLDVIVKVKPGQSVFIAGGAGGVGHFAVQVAKAAGATVISSGGKQESLEVLKRLHTDHIIDYKKDVIEQIKAVTGGQGVDIAYDSTYVESSFINSAKSVKNGGTLVILGSLPSEDSEATKIAKANNVALKTCDLVPFCFGTQAQIKERLVGGLQHGMALIIQGKLKPYISNTISLEEIQAELDLNKNGQGRPGKVVATIGKKH